MENSFKNFLVIYLLGIALFLSIFAMGFSLGKGYILGFFVMGISSLWLSIMIIIIGGQYGYRMR